MVRQIKCFGFILFTGAFGCGQADDPAAYQAKLVARFADHAAMGWSGLASAGLGAPFFMASGPGARLLGDGAGELEHESKAREIAAVLEELFPAVDEGNVDRERFHVRHAMADMRLRSLSELGSWGGLARRRLEQLGDGTALLLRELHKAGEEEPGVAVEVPDASGESRLVVELFPRHQRIKLHWSLGLHDALLTQWRPKGAGELRNVQPLLNGEEVDAATWTAALRFARGDKVVQKRLWLTWTATPTAKSKKACGGGPACVQLELADPGSGRLRAWYNQRKEQLALEKQARRQKDWEDSHLENDNGIDPLDYRRVSDQKQNLEQQLERLQSVHNQANADAEELRQQNQQLTQELGAARTAGLVSQAQNQQLTQQRDDALQHVAWGTLRENDLWEENQQLTQQLDGAQDILQEVKEHLAAADEGDNEAKETEEIKNREVAPKVKELIDQLARQADEAKEEKKKLAAANTELEKKTKWVEGLKKTNNELVAERKELLGEVKDLTKKQLSLMNLTETWKRVKRLWRLEQTELERVSGLLTKSRQEFAFQLDDMDSHLTREKNSRNDLTVQNNKLREQIKNMRQKMTKLQYALREKDLRSQNQEDVVQRSVSMVMRQSVKLSKMTDVSRKTLRELTKMSNLIKKYSDDKFSMKKDPMTIVVALDASIKSLSTWVVEETGKVGTKNQ
ncbi:MAG: hypothetical protein AAF471_06715 [Myxococcota bacterium]